MLGIREIRRIQRLGRQRIVQRRGLRIIADRSNPLEDLEDDLFLLRFRLSKAGFLRLLQLLHLTAEDNRGQPLPPHLQLLLFLRFTSTGSFQYVVGDYIQCSKQSVAKYIGKIARCIAGLRPEFISFQSTPHVIQKFFEIAAFPRVTGAIDCTHVQIGLKDGTDAQLYYCHHGYYSLNVQVVCDAEQRITNIVARWPGSTHDSRIFDLSSLKEEFEQEEHGQGILLGDAGYPSTTR